MHYLGLLPLTFKSNKQGFEGKTAKMLVRENPVIGHVFFISLSLRQLDMTEILFTQPLTQKC